MPPPPVVWTEWKFRRAFENAGWVFKRQKGSHMILAKLGMRTVPNHTSSPNHVNAA